MCMMESTLPQNSAAAVTGGHINGVLSPRKASVPKHVTFELVFDQPEVRARLPLRVSIFSHDTTESIVTTVKNFYGLYSGPTVSKGVSFEDNRGNTLIANYDNFWDNMTVYVRVIDHRLGQIGGNSYQSLSMNNSAAYLDGDGHVSQAHRSHAEQMSRPVSRTSRRRSMSPNGLRDRRSDSVSTNHTAGKKGRSRSSKTRGPGSQANGDALSDHVNDYSSGDGAPVSISGKAKEGLIGVSRTEISVENIVEGGRRKRAKFESSELPLFAPPQMPAATSNPSVSPVRRSEPHRYPLPYAQSGQNPFTHPRPFQSPQDYTNGLGQAALYATPSTDSRRARDSMGTGLGSAKGIMPTPDPTVGSCMSEEDKDVAMQLMRLGEVSHLSHGRTSASTLDDTFSGRADAASSTGATSEESSDSGQEMPAVRRQKLDVVGHHKKIVPATDTHFVPPHNIDETDGDDGDYMDEDITENGLTVPSKTKSHRPKVNPHMGPKSRNSPNKASKALKQAVSKPKKPAVAPGPMSPASLPTLSRKASVASNQTTPLAPGEDDRPDLSSKPRCQRCRKSKKGCDRQRPCGRCRDAGIPADQCISEDEGNGRKGRYGRHMGVPLLKDEMPTSVSTPLPPVPFAPTTLFAPTLAIDKNKKRKR